MDTDACRDMTTDYYSYEISSVDGGILVDGASSIDVSRPSCVRAVERRTLKMFQQFQSRRHYDTPTPTRRERTRPNARKREEYFCSI
jgi:hypothetical protein